MTSAGTGAIIKLQDKERQTKEEREVRVMYKVTVWDGENTATYIINGYAVYAITAEANALHFKAFGKNGIKFTTEKF